jgi:hypothetical protein
MEFGNQECKPKTEDLAPAPINNKTQIKVIKLGFILGAKLNTTSKSREPNIVIIAKKPTLKIQSPTLFWLNAKIAALLDANRV